MKEVEGSVSAGREISVCPSHGEGFGGYSLQGKRICRPGLQGYCVGLFCLLLQTLLSLTGFDKTAARQAGKLSQK